MTRPGLDAAVARLDDYLRRRELPAEDATTEAYEEDLFARALEGAAPELRFMQDLASTVREMGARGTLDLWLTAREAAQVRATRAHVAYFDIADPSVTIPDDAELLIVRFPVALDGIRAVDVEVLAPDGRVAKRMPDVPFDPADGAIFACCDAALARIGSGSLRLTRIWGTGPDAGDRRLLFEIPAT